MCSLWYLCLWNLLRLMVSKRKRYTSCIFVKKIFLSSLSLSLSLSQRTRFLGKDKISSGKICFNSKLYRYDGMAQTLWWKNHSARKIIKRAKRKERKKKDIGNQISHTKCLFLKICSLVWWIPTVSDIKARRGHLLFCTTSGTDNRQTHPNVCLNPALYYVRGTHKILSKPIFFLA